MILLLLEPDQDQFFTGGRGVIRFYPFSVFGGYERNEPLPLSPHSFLQSQEVGEAIIDFAL
ncbi:MAG: hypothetical protein CMO55_20135 [Verrucomicrobiales bacterium]|nr:hypothetical protein [Verrucomicrobiales bacterium]